jgi:hypothetical protein
MRDLHGAEDDRQRPGPMVWAGGEEGEARVRRAGREVPIEN